MRWLGKVGLMMVGYCLRGHRCVVVGHRVLVLIVGAQGLHKVLVSISQAFIAP